MKNLPRIVLLSASLSLIAPATAAIDAYATVTIIPSQQSLHMNWTPLGGWAVALGGPSNVQPLYLTPAFFVSDDPFPPMYAQGFVGSANATPLSLSTAFIAADTTVGTSLSYSGNIDLSPVDNSLSTYAGLRYNLGGGNYHYGWVQYATNADSTRITLLGAAFNAVANQTILAGQGPSVAATPEPSACLLGGSPALIGGFALMRRRRPTAQA